MCVLGLQGGSTTDKVAAGAVLHLSALQASAVIIHCKPGAWGRANAAKNIARLDGASQDVQLERIVPLSLDATL